MVEEVTDYTAIAQREGKWWVVRVPELGRTTQVRRVDQIDEYVRDLVGLFTEEDPSGVSVAVRLTVPTRDAAIAQALELRRNSDDIARRSAAATEETARALVEDGMSLRDAGAVLGVSFQRVQQIVGPRVPQNRSTS